jgi:hypothetical protein
MAGPSQQRARRCPTLPHSLPCSTIGAEGLNFRVRNGTGCFPSAITTERPTPPTNPHKKRGPAAEINVQATKLRTTKQHSEIKRRAQNPFVQREPHRDANTAQQTTTVHEVSFKPLGLLVPVNSTRYRASMSGLSTQWSAGGLNPPRKVGGRTHLKEGFPLRCFQRLSLPNVANQPCPWRDNWHTRGSSVPVLSY